MKTNDLPFSKSFFKNVLFCLLFAAPVLIHGQESTDNKTIAPYFVVLSTDTTIDQLPLKETSADVSICGVIADVKISQKYSNNGDVPLEAIYVFPASTKAAVYAMRMKIGDRVINAEIKEKEKAREEYEQAQEEGKTVSLLEQERPNVFKMNVANILPGDNIEVQISYTELITPSEGIYEFVYPAVVGPRYVEDSESGWAELPYTHEGENATYDFGINLSINAGMSLKEISSPSHPKTLIKESSYFTYTAQLYDTEGSEGNRDFILRYKLSGETIESAAMFYDGEEENFFLSMIQPPENLTEIDIPKREYVFIMDVSGSMRGFPIEISKKLLTDLINNLRPTDKFNVLFFAGDSRVLSEFPLNATSANLEKAIDMIDSQNGGGSTRILNAIQNALAMPTDEFNSRIFVIATDGYVTVEKEVFNLIQNELGEANFFPFGIGSSVNRYIIEGIAHAGMAEPFIVLNQDEASEKAEQFRKMIEYPALTNIDCDFKNFNAYDIIPTAIADVMAHRPILVFGKYNGVNTGYMKITGISGTLPYEESLVLNTFEPTEKNSALKYLWARHKIQTLSDFQYVGEDNKDEIIELGLKYNLLTNYTSFIAVDSIIRNEGGNDTTVIQPLPIPERVTDNALGGFGFAAGVTGYSMNRKFNSDGPINQLSGYPNPFSEELKISFIIKHKFANSSKFLKLYNYLGQLIVEINISDYGEGEHIITVNPLDYPEFSTGVYFLQLEISNKQKDSITINYISK